MALGIEPIDPNSLTVPPIGPVEGPELEQRKSGWKNFLTQLNDPNVKSAIAQTGMGLMRTPGYGQSGWDTASQALQSGVGTLQALRERDRLLAQAAADRAAKEAQQTTSNKLNERQAATSERNAATQERQVESSAQQNANANNRAGFALEENIRHNKETEKNAAEMAKAANTRATTASSGRNGKTSAEIEKINRLQKYYMAQGMDELEADKKAIDYVSNSKGKPPRQLVIESIQSKAKQWFDSQFDPNAQLPPELLEKFKQEAIAEVKMADEAGRDITDSAIAPPVVPSVTASKDPMVVRKINKWVESKATDEQVNELLRKQGVDPKLYGY